MVIIASGLVVFIGLYSRLLHKSMASVINGGLALSSLASVAYFIVVLNMNSLLLTNSVTMWYMPVLSLAVSCWLIGLIYVVQVEGGVNYLSHFTLWSLGRGVLIFLPFFELLSVCLRPLTLGVRLATNISSGHILLCLAAVASSGFIGIGLVWPFVIILVCLEVFVALLQGCVFSILVVMYISG